MAISFLALPVIPELKITDKGLVDVTKFRIVPVFETTSACGMEGLTPSPVAFSKIKGCSR
jgi:hypothetical protein